jgi:hypothetical protein
MSQMSLDSGAGTSRTQYDAPHASSYDTPGPSTRVPEMQAPLEARHERPHREIRPRDTYNLSLIQMMFHMRWCFFFLIYDFKFIFFIYVFTLTSYKIFI